MIPRVVSRLVLATLLVGSTAAAQEEPLVRVEVTVTTVSGQSAYVDQGREQGIQPGDRVELFPAGEGRVTGTIRSVSRASARATLARGISSVTPGTSGEVLVPAARLAPPPEQEDESEPLDETEEEGAPPSGRVPPAPVEWEQAPEEWSEEVPLLAPAHTRPAEERETTFRGTLFTGFDWTQDESFVDQRFLGSNTRLDLEYENPFHRGGALQLALAYFWRSADLPGGNDETDANLRVDRASYRSGGRRAEPTAWEAGRFLHSEFSELGVLDGYEIVHRLPSGSRVGASLGFLPEPDDEFTSGDDLQASVFYRYVSDESESLALGSAFQKTWHEGAADRDLAILSLDVYPSDSTSAHATAWIDYYTSGDSLKSSGLELTQLDVRGDWRLTGGHGIGVYVAHLKWPDIERREFASQSPATISDGFVTRYGTNGWMSATPDLRLDVRLEQWQDESDAGGSASGRMALSGLLDDRGRLTTEGFTTTGSFSSTVGGRVAFDWRLDLGALRLGWDASRHSQEDFQGSQENLTNQALRTSYDVAIGETLYLSVYGERRFGDGQDALSLGFQLQKGL